MKISEENSAEPWFEITINEEPWKRVESFANFGPNEPVYTVSIREDGILAISFGDGVNGSRLPTGEANIRTSYRSGAGLVGALGSEITVSLNWTSRSLDEHEIIGIIIEPKVNEFTLRVRREADSPHRWKWVKILYRKIKRWTL